MLISVLIATNKAYASGGSRGGSGGSLWSLWYWKMTEQNVVIPESEVNLHPHAVLVG